MNSEQKIEGIVIELRGSKALVEFTNGDKRWFVNDGQDLVGKVGNTTTIEAVQSRMPSNQAELFEFLERQFAGLSIEHFMSMWGEGRIEHNGQEREAIAVGSGITIANVVSIYGAPSARYFFLTDLAEDTNYFYECDDFDQMECAIDHIVELLRPIEVPQGAAK